LNSRPGDGDLVVSLVGHGLATHTEVVVIAELENVGEEIVAFNDQVFDDSIDHRVRHFNARDGYIAGVGEDGRDDDLGEILDQMRLEGRLAILIVAKIQEEFLDSITESLVLGITLELLGEELDLIEDAIGVTSITFSEKMMTLIVDLVPFIGGLIL
jgi:hypothetical protein